MHKDFKTFAELADYAHQRARRSAGRGDYLAFAQWHETARWAADMAETPGSDAQAAAMYDSCLSALDTYKRIAKPTSPLALARYHAHAAALRQMLVNRGAKPPRLSLDWLREAATVMSDVSAMNRSYSNAAAPIFKRA